MNISQVSGCILKYFHGKLLSVIKCDNEVIAWHLLVIFPNNFISGGGVGRVQTNWALDYIYGGQATPP